MSNGLFRVPQPVNEPVLGYAPDSKEKNEVKSVLAALKQQKMQIPLIIGGKEIFTDKTGDCLVPHEKSRVIGVYHKAGKTEIDMAVQAAMDAKAGWQKIPWEQRASVFLKAADLITGPYRALMNAATMLTQSKTIHQAEIDAVCELADFFRFNAYFLNEIYGDQPNSADKIWNRTDYRPLEGFVFAVTPFNFTSIAGNLPTAPAIAGNTVIWKPSSASVYSNYLIIKILMEAGLPDGVINFLPGSGNEIGSYILKNEHLAGVHFTGSTGTFHSIWKTIGENIDHYRSYPRIVGETGGKDYVFVHSSADVEEVGTALIRGAFEYQGQKCSAASRAYLPEDLYPPIRKFLRDELSQLKMGDPEDFTNFLSAVIDENAFQKIRSYIEDARSSNDAEILIGGTCDDNNGYFIEPTVIVAKDPNYKTMTEEIFGPVLTLFVYETNKFEDALQLCNETSPYGLTGAVFAKDRKAIAHMTDILYQSAGNFYINDKPTGAVVGQQPFGGARGSGTNDKAGSKTNLMRWMNQMTIKENFIPPKTVGYEFMKEE